MNRTPMRRRWASFAALGTIGFVVSSLLTFVALRARANELLLGASDAAFHYERALHPEGTDELRLNGLGFRVVSGSTADSLRDVLDRVEAKCADENADLRAELEKLRRGPARARATVNRLHFAGTLRAEGNGRGAVACLGRHPGSRDSTWTVRLRAFLATGDVSEIGAVRLIFVTERSRGTSYVALSSEGPLPLEAAFPKKGDAPGRDPADVPRPAAAERRLAAWAPGTTASVFVYEVAESDPSLALSRYARALASSGWTVSERGGSQEHLVARLGQRALVASTAKANRDSSLVSIATL